MRDDSLGFFWQDVPAEKGKRSLNRIMPDIPETGWVAPRDFPRLDSAPWISLDTETKDPNLLESGPGWARGDGHIVGVSIAVPERSWYFPVRHEVCPEQNLDPVHVFAWLRDTMERHAKKPVIGANLLYDIGWLGEEDVRVQGRCYDIQFAEALLSERGDVNLQHLATKYLAAGKETSLLYQWSCDYYGGQANEKQRANIYRCPPSLVGPYAEADAALPARILPFQWERLHAEGLVNIFGMETDLIPLLIAMRRRGVRVDIPRAEQVRDALVVHVAGLNRQLKELVGFEVNVSANDSIQKAFKHLGVPMPLNADGNPSFTKDTLPLVDHPIGEMILTIRKRDKVRSTFIESAILEKHVNGRVHCSLHPLRGDEGGTRSGRFSSSDPNLQQVPSRDEELSPLVRGIFVPDIGHKQWRRYDYNQIEYRFNAHYAVGQGSDELRARYNADPKTDFHVDAQKMVTNYTGIEIPRKPIKNMNFGLTFGMGKDKLIRSLTTELLKMGRGFKLDGVALYDAYHEALPFTKATMEHFSNLASSVGYVTTILGRRSRFDLWEPDVRTKRGEERKPALSYEVASRVYGKIKRAHTHKALNRVLQGSGTGDLIKKAMLLCWQSGVYDVVGVPGLTVHDELDHSDAGGNEEAWTYVQHTLENAIPGVRVPILAALEVGATWGDAT